MSDIDPSLPDIARTLADEPESVRLGVSKSLTRLARMGREVSATPENTALFIDVLESLRHE